MTTWHVLIGDDSVCGPYTECQIRNGIQQGKIADPMRVRQGQSPWLRVSKVRAIFGTLDEQGFFIRDEKRSVFGPFTASRLQAMKIGNNLPLVYWVRKGKHGKWERVDRRPAPEPDEYTQTVSESVSATSAPEILVTADSVAVDETSTTSIASDSETLTTEPKTVVPAAPVMKLRSSTWKSAITGISERFENLILGDPLTN